MSSCLLCREQFCRPLWNIPCQCSSPLCCLLLPSRWAISLWAALRPYDPLTQLTLLWHGHIWSLISNISTCVFDKVTQFMILLYCSLFQRTQQCKELTSLNTPTSSQLLSSLRSVLYFSCIYNAGCYPCFCVVVIVVVLLNRLFWI